MDIGGRNLQRGGKGLPGGGLVALLEFQEAQLPADPGIMRAQPLQGFQSGGGIRHGSLLQQPMSQLAPTPDIAGIFLQDFTHQPDGLRPTTAAGFHPSATAPQYVHLGMGGGQPGRDGLHRLIKLLMLGKQFSFDIPSLGRTGVKGKGTVQGSQPLGQRPGPGEHAGEHQPDTVFTGMFRRQGAGKISGPPGFTPLTGPVLQQVPRPFVTGGNAQGGFNLGESGFGLPLPPQEISVAGVQLRVAGGILQGGLINGPGFFKSSKPFERASQQNRGPVPGRTNFHGTPGGSQFRFGFLSPLMDLGQIQPDARQVGKTIGGLAGKFQRLVEPFQVPKLGNERRPGMPQVRTFLMGQPQAM